MTLPIERMRHGRAPISDSARVLLCSLAAGDVRRPLPRVDADWEEVFRGVCRNGLLGLTHRTLQHQDSQDYPPPAFRHKVHLATRIDAVRMAVKQQSVEDVLERLNQAGLDTMVVKGPAIAHTLYPKPALRPYNDLDLVVRERDWAAAHQLLVEMGFSSEEDLPQPPPKLTPLDILYEQKYRHPETELLVEVHYDDILNAGLAARDVEGFWHRASQIDVQGLPIKVMSLEDQLIHMCVHLHYHGYTRLNNFSDMAFAVRDYGMKLDWERLLETVRVEGAQVGVYYSLLYLEQLLGVKVPEGVLDALQPDGFRRWLHERLLPTDSVLSLQPMWRPDFSFYFRPLFKRLLPDLLVMGRRADKLRYLLRLLVPPEAWLRNHYGLGGTRMIALHYVLHPLKLLYHYLAEVLDAILHPRDTFIADENRSLR